MVPEGWRRESLGRLVEEVSRRGGGNLPVLTVSKDLGIVLQTEKFGRVIASDDRSRYKRATRGQFVYDPMLLWSGSVARQDRVEEGVVSPAYYVFRIKGPELDSEFLRNVLTDPRQLPVYASISEGTNTRRKKARFEAFSRVEILLPPLPEQRKIATILSSVDDAIAATRKVIEQTEQVKKGLLQTLMTRGIGHTRFKKTEVGEIPEGWEVVELGDILGSVSTGVSVRSVARRIVAGEVGVLKTGCVAGGTFHPDQHKAVLMNQIDRVRESPRRGSIILSRMNTQVLVGESGFVEEDHPHLFLPDRLWQFQPRPGSAVDGRWLSFLLISPAIRDRIRALGSGTSASMKNISQGKLLALRVPRPPMEEQRRITVALRSARVAEASSSTNLAHLQTLKRGLLQDLLTGRVRVTPD